jgi:hypothetical protein
MRTALLIVAVVVAGRAAAAHHSYSNYEMDRIVEFSGVLVKVRTDEGRLVVAEWLAPVGLARRQVDPALLKKGDRVILSGNPHREFTANGILNFKSVTRPADGLKWEVPVRQGSR